MEIKNFMKFIEKSGTAFHAVENLKNMLEAEGFEDLKRVEKVKLGGSYFKVRNDSSIIAFKIPNNKNFKSFRLTSAHSDSPCYKIKANPVIYKYGYTLLNVAPYGGMIHSTFFDTPLKIAGRVVCLDKDNNLYTKLIDFVEPNVAIANLAIHFNREVNKGYEYKPAKDVVPILGLGEIDLFKVIKDKFELSGEIVSHDLFVVSAVKPYVWGMENEFISSPRLDDLECAYASMRALINSDVTEGAMSLVFNNEEVGSLSYMGANSDFLVTVMTKIREDLGLSESWMYECLENSFVISGDNAHALHPNYTDTYDLNNYAMLNKGPAIKFSPSQKYTTDAVTAAKFMALCKKANVAYQCFENHSNVAGGSTLGNISISQVSIPSVDIGLPQLAMHSACELAGTKDFIDLIKVFETHFSLNK
ncbi:MULTISPECIES: M18 family aminopeptidase [Fusobacterium]|uniref:M18 family aminopeptidase n=1 Tax=Fusobacterium hominis TaxID=2764326 RepID=A0A7G9GYN6_9FUSO|nr:MULTISPECIES: M18 family aminopeptidase [Fusobacterium]QNM15918.1 M18 family aminopeptidase [Fusobacterium hominis]